VSSGSRISEFAKVVTNYKEVVDLVVFSRISGGAAQYGLAEASKILFKEGIPFLVLADLTELDELGLLKDKDAIIIQFSKLFGKPFSQLGEILSKNIAGDKRVFLVLSGSETGFSKSELLENANLVYPSGVRRELPPESYVVLFMHLLLNDI